MADGETDKLVVYFQPGASADCAAAAAAAAVRRCSADRRLCGYKTNAALNLRRDALDWDETLCE